MKIIKGKNIWDTKATNICITTNGITKNNGEAVWGAGIAKQAKERWKPLPSLHAKFLKQHGHVFGLLATVQIKPFHDKKSIFTFPTKYHWKDKSDIRLIVQSAEQLVRYSILYTPSELRNYAIPAPGCNNGGLDFDYVMAVLEPILVGDNFWIYTL